MPGTSRLSPLVVDRSLAAVCVLGQVIVVVPGEHPVPGPAAAAVSSVVGLVSGLAILVWRRRTEPVLLVVVLGYAVQALVEGPLLPVAVAVACFLASRTVPSPRGPAIAAGAAVVTVAAAAVHGGSVAPTYGLVLLGLVLTGTVLAGRDARAAARTRDAVLAERMRIARDLHDVVGHGMGAITVQAGAGRLALDAGETADTRTALTVIETTGRSVLRDVRWLVSLLRDGPDAPGLADLPQLADGAGRAGVTVELSMGPMPLVVPSDVGEVVYRVVQESLTNVVRHSSSSTATVTVAPDESTRVLRVRITDDGPPSASADGVAANGLRGVEDRVARVGGEVSVGPRPGGGWQVEVAVPMPGAGSATAAR
jgi:signal transduction histidine kinase